MDDRSQGSDHPSLDPQVLTECIDDMNRLRDAIWKGEIDATTGAILHKATNVKVKAVEQDIHARLLAYRIAGDQPEGRKRLAAGAESLPKQ